MTLGLAFSSAGVLAYPATSTGGPGTCTGAACYTYLAKSHFGEPDQIDSSPSAACQARIAAYNNSGNMIYTAVSAQLIPNVRSATVPIDATYILHYDDCNLRIRHNTNGSIVDGRKAIFWAALPPEPIQYSCPAGGVLQGMQCVCQAPAVDTGTACDSAQNLCAELSGKAAGNYEGRGYLGHKQICEPSFSSGDSAKPGCLIVGYASVALGEGNNQYWYAKMSFTGAKCFPDPNGSTDLGNATEPNPAPPPSPPPVPPKAAPTPCPPGTTASDVNGSTICSPATGQPKVTTRTDKTTSTAADGTVTETSTTTTTTTSATGTTSTRTDVTTTTTKPDGTKTTTTTGGTSSSSGGGSGDGDGEEEGSSFGGSCSAGFTCDGDAATCAIAKGAWEARCALRAVEAPENDPAIQAGQAADTGLDPADHPRKNVTVKNVGSFDSSNPFTSSCPGDYTINAGPVVGSIKVPLSSACSLFQLMGSLMVGLTLLASAMWIVRGV